MKKSVYLLLVLSIFLSGCGLAEKKEDAPTYTELPTIESKYDEETLNLFDSRRKQGTANRYEGLTIASNNILSRPNNLPASLFYDSGISIDYPKEGVKGIYLPVSSLNDIEHFNYNLEKLDNTPLNAVVLDFKDDSGQIIPNIQSENVDVMKNVVNLFDYKSLMQTLQAHQIYPIARIVTFKDNYLAHERPDLAFQTKDGQLWANEGANYINPFLREAWDYNIEIAIQAAKMGFKEIQFDYVRFSDAFIYEEQNLNYTKGEFENYISQNPDAVGEERVAAITQFLAYAKERLAPYGVHVSADLFGIVAISPNDIGSRGIGQNFAKIASVVDIVSSMVYPDHWGAGLFGIESPRDQPYDLINEYMLSEKQLLSSVSNPAKTRPWIQNYYYEAEQIQAQINALADNQVYEYLLWNALGEFYEEVDYAPELSVTAD